MITTTAFETWKGEDGILRTRVKPNLIITLEMAKENTAAVNELADRSVYLIVDIKNIKGIEKDARDHFSLRGRESKVVAFAMIIKSPLSRMVGNFFMGLNKPAVPVRLFNKEDKAAAWLKSLNIL